MKIILKESVDGLGHTGDLLEVANGYARNFLLPRGKALEANPRNIKQLEHLKRVTAEKARKEREGLEQIAKNISAVTLTMEVKAGKDDKLFGSVTAKDIAEQLVQRGFEVDRRRIQLPQPIKELGTYPVAIKLHPQVTATVSVTVAKKQEAEATDSQVTDQPSE